MKEVSIGCSVKTRTCSICGDTDGKCGHIPGREYDGKLCYMTLDDPQDIYEWSFIERTKEVEDCDQSQKSRNSVAKKEANMDKPLKDWTFSEAQEFCGAQRNTPERCSTCKIKEFCDKYFGRQGESASPKYWDLSEKPRFTEQEVEDAKAVRRVFGHEYRLERTSEGAISFGGLILSAQLFPSIHPGQSYTLDDIIGGAE